MELINKIKRNLSTIGKPLTVHTEAIVLDKVWEEVKKRVLTGKIHKWYVMTPANYEYSKVFLNLKISKKEYSKILKKRYRWLLVNKQRLGLHVHLSPIMNISYKEQEKMIKEAIRWMEIELGLKTDEIVFGWWKNNEDTKKILNKLGIRIIKYSDYKSIHEYDWIIFDKPLKQISWPPQIYFPSHSQFLDNPGLLSFSSPFVKTFKYRGIL